MRAGAFKRWGLGLSIWVLLLPGCTTINYYSQSIGGHLGLMAQRTEITQLLADDQTDEVLKKRLQSVLDIRDFASAELGLPNNGSYRSYVDVGQPYVLWNVVTTSEFSLTPHRWCYPITGCVAYRGYYSQIQAREFADRLKGRRLDVFIGGVRAYSTLGWFDDPVLNTMLTQPFPYLAGVIFHELAHQQLYIKDDTTFNESFAVAVEREVVRRWFQHHDDAQGFKRYRELLVREERFVQLILESREHLAELYTRDLDSEQMRAKKSDIFSNLRTQYHQRSEWFGQGFAQWFDEDLNNAKLALIATYHDQVPAFERLLAQHNGDLSAFYQEVENIGALSREERAQRMRSLAD